MIMRDEDAAKSDAANYGLAGTRNAYAQNAAAQLQATPANRESSLSVIEMMEHSARRTQYALRSAVQRLEYLFNETQPSAPPTLGQGQADGPVTNIGTLAQCLDANEQLVNRLDHLVSRL